MGVIGVGLLACPYDVDFLPSGEIAVADRDNRRVCVFSRGGGSLITAFGSHGCGAGQFEAPFALAVGGDKLFVLDNGSDRVQVFQ